MTELLNLTGKIDDNTISTFEAVGAITEALKIPYLIVGATARDIVLHYGYGAPIRRATTDIDYAINVESWGDFEALKEQLINIDFTCGTAAHRLISPTNIPIDIVPFGAIELDNVCIAWPPNGDLVMSVMGFQEALDNAQPVIICEKRDVRCNVVTPECLMFLKIISWNERSTELKRKDADDIRYLLKTYHNIKNIKADIYDEENVATLERYGWDQELAACFLMGKTSRKLVLDRTYGAILKIEDSNTTDNISRLVSDMEEGLPEDNLNLLSAFFDGFRSCAPENGI